MTSWAELRSALSRFSAREVAGGRARAAVALVFRDTASGAGLELLFIRRAEYENDPWSGHIGFPGGRAEAGDASAEATAVRETREETGLDLGQDGEPLGALDDVQAMARGRPVDLVIAPRVFRLRHRLEGASSHEVVSLHWLGFERLRADEVRSTLEYSHEGRMLELPCLRVDGLVIWGLTYRMLQGLLGVLEGESSIWRAGRS